MFVQPTNDVTVVVLVPLIALCNAAPGLRSTRVLIKSDAIFCILVSILALSNGYIGNICAIFAPSTLKTTKKQEKEAVSIMLNASIIFGIATGSLLGFLTCKLL